MKYAPLPPGLHGKVVEHPSWLLFRDFINPELLRETHISTLAPPDEAVDHFALSLCGDFPGMRRESFARKIATDNLAVQQIQQEWEVSR